MVMGPPRRDVYGDIVMDVSLSKWFWAHPSFWLYVWRHRNGNG
jgi:hypothetical protein